MSCCSECHFITSAHANVQKSSLSAEAQAQSQLNNKPLVIALRTVLHTAMLPSRMKAGDSAEEAKTQAQVAGGSKGHNKRQDKRLAVSHEQAMVIQVRGRKSSGIG